jgi:Sec-independent protein secretion pathway component TatC
MAAISSLRSLGRGERLALTGHLTELRARLVVCALALAVLFAGCLWQSRPLLDVLKRPLRAKRRYAIVALAILAALLPGTDPVTTVLEMIPLIALYELSIVLLRTSERRLRRRPA